MGPSPYSSSQKPVRRGTPTKPRPRPSEGTAIRLTSFRLVPSQLLEAQVRKFSVVYEGFFPDLIGSDPGTGKTMLHRRPSQSKRLGERTHGIPRRLSRDFATARGNV